jgi:hypothetical protein
MFLMAATSTSLQIYDVRSPRTPLSC